MDTIAKPCVGPPASTTTTSTMDVRDDGLDGMCDDVWVDVDVLVVVAVLVMSAAGAGRLSWKLMAVM